MKRRDFLKLATYGTVVTLLPSSETVSLPEMIRDETPAQPSGGALFQFEHFDGKVEQFPLLDMEVGHYDGFVIHTREVSLECFGQVFAMHPDEGYERYILTHEEIERAQAMWDENHFVVLPLTAEIHNNLGLPA